MHAAFALAPIRDVFLLGTGALSSQVPNAGVFRSAAAEGKKESSGASQTLSAPLLVDEIAAPGARADPRCVTCTLL